MQIVNFIRVHLTALLLVLTNTVFHKENKMQYYFLITIIVRIISAFKEFFS